MQLKAVCTTHTVQATPATIIIQQSVPTSHDVNDDVNDDDGGDVILQDLGGDRPISIDVKLKKCFSHLINLGTSAIAPKTTLANLIAWIQMQS